MENKKKHYVRPEMTVIPMDSDNFVLAGSEPFKPGTRAVEDFAKDATWVNWNEGEENERADW